MPSRQLRPGAGPGHNIIGPRHTVTRCSAGPGHTVMCPGQISTTESQNCLSWKEPLKVTCCHSPAMNRDTHSSISAQSPSSLTLGVSRGRVTSPLPAGHATLDAAQGTVGFLGCKSTLLAHAQLSSTSTPQPLAQAPQHASLHKKRCNQAMLGEKEVGVIRSPA